MASTVAGMNSGYGYGGYGSAPQLSAEEQAARKAAADEAQEDALFNKFLTVAREVSDTKPGFSSDATGSIHLGTEADSYASLKSREFPTKTAARAVLYLTRLADVLHRDASKSIYGEAVFRWSCGIGQPQVYIAYVAGLMEAKLHPLANSGTRDMSHARLIQQCVDALIKLTAHAPEVAKMLTRLLEPFVLVAPETSGAYQLFPTVSLLTPYYIAAFGQCGKCVPTLSDAEEEALSVVPDAPYEDPIAPSADNPEDGVGGMPGVEEVTVPSKAPFKARGRLTLADEEKASYVEELLAIDGAIRALKQESYDELGFSRGAITRAELEARTGAKLAAEYIARIYSSREKEAQKQMLRKCYDQLRQPMGDENYVKILYLALETATEEEMAEELLRRTATSDEKVALEQALRERCFTLGFGDRQSHEMAEKLESEQNTANDFYGLYKGQSVPLNSFTIEELRRALTDRSADTPQKRETIALVKSVLEAQTIGRNQLARRDLALRSSHHGKKFLHIALLEAYHSGEYDSLNTLIEAATVQELRDAAWEIMVWSVQFRSETLDPLLGYADCYTMLQLDPARSARLTATVRTLITTVFPDLAHEEDALVALVQLLFQRLTFDELSKIFETHCLAMQAAREALKEHAQTILNKIGKPLTAEYITRKYAEYSQRAAISAKLIPAKIMSAKAYCALGRRDDLQGGKQLWASKRPSVDSAVLDELLREPWHFQFLDTLLAERLERSESRNPLRRVRNLFRGSAATPVNKALSDEKRQEKDTLSEDGVDTDQSGNGDGLVAASAPEAPTDWSPPAEGTDEPAHAVVASAPDEDPTSSPQKGKL